MTKRSGSYDNVSRRISCLLQQHKLAPVVCIGAWSAEEGLGTGTQRRHDRQVLRGNLETEMQLAHCSTGAGCCSSRSRGRLCCSRTLLLGQSVTRQVERDVVLHRACWQLLTVIPMPGEGLAHRRQPIFDPTAVFWRLQPGLELHSLDSEQATIVELGTFFKLEWRLFAANPTSSSARVSFAAFDKLIVFVSATSCGLLWGSKHEIAAQLQSSIHASLQLSCCRTVSLALFPSTHPPRTLTSPKTS